MKYQIFHGDSFDILKSQASHSVDSLVTDPPAGIGLFGIDWDQNKGGRDKWICWLSCIMTECYRVLKPGGHGFVWALPRTSHWTATALELAGFEVKDVVTHVFGSGFPKNTFVEKAMSRVKYTDTEFLFKATNWIRSRRDELKLTNKDLDQIAGVKGGACHWTARPPKGNPLIPTKERWEKLEQILGPAPDWLTSQILPSYKIKNRRKNLTFPIHDDSKPWLGWGTSLKPASEHWILIQKPISEHNIAANIKKHGTGALNIMASRIPVIGKIPSTSNLNFHDGGLLWNNSERSQHSIYHQHPAGRFPANFLLTRTETPWCPAEFLKTQDTGPQKSAQYFKSFKPEIPFLYCKKPGKKEKGSYNGHPTVKPLNLMRYYCKMVTPHKGVVLDPFMGSGSTGVAAIQENFHFLGIESNKIYLEIAEKRLKEAHP